MNKPKMLKSDVEDKVREILEREYGLSHEDVYNDSDFRDDMSLDSLDLVEFIIELEKEFGIGINDVQAEVLVESDFKNLITKLADHINII